MMNFSKNRFLIGLSRGRFLAALLVLCGLVVPVLGETKVEIRGMKSKSEAEVFQLIGGRLVYIRTKEANSWRANDAAYMVREILANDGYYKAEVVAKVEGVDRIALIVDEGTRLSVGEVLVEIDGEENSEKDVEALQKTFVAPFGSSGRFALGGAPFREDNVPNGLDFVARELKADGFWNAEASIKSKDIDPDTGAVNIVVSVKKGRRFKIRNPTVDSPDGRGVKRAATTWAPFLEKWATTENVNQLRSAMVEAFISRGYPDATILMANRLGNDSYFPDFRIELGVRVKLLELDITGLERTQEERMREILGPLKDGWYDEAAMNKKLRDLLATGAFSAISADTYEVEQKRINAMLHFKEADAKEITFSGGVDSFNGPLLRAGFSDRNFRGKLRGFSVGLELSARGILGEVKLTDPWWRGTNILRSHRGYSLIKAFEGYTTNELGYESGWEYEFTDHYSVSVLAGLSAVIVTAEGLPEELLGATDYLHSWLLFIQSIDFRDSKILPKAGWHLDFPLGIGAAVGTDTNTYVRAGLDGGFYYALSDTWQLGIGGFAEFVGSSNGVGELPVDLRVFNGGARSVRSFPERELGPSFEGDAFGGDFGWAVNTELSRVLTGSLQVVGFVDAGLVTGDFTGPREGGLEVAAGVGIRVDLPIGPVRLEYGKNLTQGVNEPSGTFHFAIGTTF